MTCFAPARIIGTLQGRSNEIDLVKGIQTVFVCQQCGYRSSKWLGKCVECGEWNSLMEEHRPRTSGARHGRASALVPQAKPYPSIEQKADSHLPTGLAEFDRVLGGGMVPGSVVLIGGDPGIGKSTLLLQVADHVCAQGLTVLYVSGEESEQQIRMRGDRLGIQAQGLFVLAETQIRNVLEIMEHVMPSAVVVDSIQTIYSDQFESTPGSVSQIREVAAQLLGFAKQRGATVFLIGHVTKEGVIAGPKALEHLVDTVLYFEGERQHNHRIVRATKNRYGATHELGIFEMTGRGLIPVTNPSSFFLSERPEGVPGTIVAACMEGTRPLLVEVQALVTSNKYGAGRRMVLGVDPNRVAIILAVLEKRVGFHLGGEDVFVNLTGGLVVDEPAIDLPVAAAISSSFTNQSIDSGTVAFGEIGLAGEVRAATAAALRVKESQTLGFKRCLLPAGNLSGLDGSSMEFLGARSVVDALERLF